MDAMYAKLADAIEKSNKTYDLPRIEAAYELDKKAHEGQMRSSGDPYISHPIEVAIILVGLGMDSDTIIGGLLHDVVEDTSVTLEDIEKQFGGDVAELVDGVTKLANIPYSSRAEQQAENVTIVAPQHAAEADRQAHDGDGDNEHHAAHGGRAAFGHVPGGAVLLDLLPRLLPAQPGDIILSEGCGKQKGQDK